jgi:hypothetical protein
MLEEEEHHPRTLEEEEAPRCLHYMKEEEEPRPLWPLRMLEGEEAPTARLRPPAQGVG